MCSYGRPYLCRRAPRHAFVEAQPVCSMPLSPVKPPATIQPRETEVTRTGRRHPTPVVAHIPHSSHLAREPVITFVVVVDLVSTRRHPEHVAARLACGQVHMFLVGMQT